MLNANKHSRLSAHDLWIVLVRFLLSVRPTLHQDSHTWSAWQQVQVSSLARRLRYASTFFFSSSLFGCPYNLHANRPWLRRTVRGAIATSIVVASPVLVVGVVTAAAVVLPPVGIYRLARHLKARRERRNAVNMGRVRLSVALEDNDLLHRVVPRADVRRERELLLRARTRRMEEEQDDVQEDATDNDSNLAIFGDLDVTHLFLETGTEDDQESKPSVIERARMEESLSTTSYADDFFRRSSTTVE